MHIPFTGIEQEEKVSAILQGSDRGKEAIRAEDEAQ